MDIAEKLDRAVGRHLGQAKLADLRQLTGGASQEIWSFTADIGQGAMPLILRRSPPGIDVSARDTAISLGQEAEIQRRAANAHVPVAHIRFILDPTDQLGEGYVMDFVAGETIARKILRDAAFAKIRPELAQQCGRILARLHQVPTAGLGLRPFGARDQLARYHAIYKGFGDPRPVFDWAFAWLGRHKSVERATPDEAASVLVHGDFRNGNLMIGPDGVRAVLDWELAHLGDGHEDMGWICVNSWRFGEIDHPVGGFGSREDMFKAYEAGGNGPVDPERVRFWETFGTLKWGIMCMTMTATHLSGAARSVERAVIGRRSSETEIDLLNLIAGPN
jgi:aminoglycoside phosphotransferase (APT) family kinase protein